MATKQAPKTMQDSFNADNQMPTSSPVDRTHPQEILETPDQDIIQDHTLKSNPVGGGVENPGNTPPNPTSPPPKVLYHHIYKDAEDNIVENIEGPEPISAGDTGAPKTLTHQTALEILTIKGLYIRNDTKQPVQKLTTTMKIYSMYLINVLRDVVHYWPGLNLQDHPVKIRKPYAVLIHHLDELRMYKDRHPVHHSHEYVKLCNEDIDILIGIVDKECGEDIRSERKRYQKSPPMATFENLWMLFKPGQDVYVADREGKVPIPMRVACLERREQVSLHYSRYLGRPANRSWGLGEMGYPFQYDALMWTVTGWGVGCTGNAMSAQRRDTSIEFFDGEREITSLMVYPKEFHSDPDLENRFQMRGKRYWDLCAPAYRHYDGVTIADRGQPTTQLNGRIVIDFNSYIKYKHEISTLDEGDEDPQISYTDEYCFSNIPSDWKRISSSKGCECDCCRESPRSRKVDVAIFDLLNGSMTTADGDPQMYFLSDYILRGYALKEQMWLSFHIDQVQILRVEESPFDNLILPGDVKNTIQSIIWSYKQPGDEVKAWSADFIQEKGEGQIFLLHGTPGVGKTCTAEIVADYMRRPLLPLTCGDMGITASEVQHNINKYFELGERWGAVILMDEADIYLEQRASDQLERNSLVSVFLRALEYFRGILFITTNRVGTFDDAFISRIHVALYYPPLVDRDRVSIWENNFRRLERDSAIKVAESTRIYTRYDDGLRQIEWNGREIRNALQTAVALAKKEASDKKSAFVTLEAHHIEAVVKMSRSFKAYLTEVHDNLDEAGRARKVEARVDDFDLKK
ncbi:P-loop containing nucleoside triphosphate hydrolase protein [Hyaloscypha variabilis F]|uniref:P-loop containing nucleoside triphosphate hydrolase protein n=1 Tax=Hyaloscypha variabilis (strain UAMH 11265 / GT02V1 / F) TaxID=1149755 RepID=A0A2J6RQN2_HYAVF|nr:P-loop containing nucleoside triphosphate hydrolase protein [Hyaloscypha variabilis F]